MKRSKKKKLQRAQSEPYKYCSVCGRLFPWYDLVYYDFGDGQHCFCPECVNNDTRLSSSYRTVLELIPRHRDFWGVEYDNSDYDDIW